MAWRRKLSGCAESGATIKILVRRDFKGKICAYCSKAMASSEDHVFARQFFLEEDRNNLPKAPSCDACNGTKAALEGYLTVALPFAGRHTQAVDNLTRGVPKRLNKNRKIGSEMLGSMKPAWLRGDGGIYKRTSVVDFDGDKLIDLLKFIGRGLAWHHWKVYLRPNDAVSVMFVKDRGTLVFQSLLAKMRPERHVDQNLGNGTVLYRGLQAPEPPQLTVWTISMYGGVVLSDDRSTAGGEAESCTVWWIFTGPPELGETSALLR